MTIGWQDVLAGTVVVTSACYLARRGWQTLARKKTGGCGACAHCPSQIPGPSASPATGPHVVAIDVRPPTNESAG